MSESSFELSSIYLDKNLRLIDSMYDQLSDEEKDVILVLRDVRKLMLKYGVSYSGITVYDFEVLIAERESEEYAQALTNCLLKVVIPSFRFSIEDLEAIEFYHFCKMIAKKQHQREDGYRAY